MRPLRLLGALAIALLGATALAARSAPAERPVIAQLGINLPTMGIVYWASGRNWRWSVANYFSPAVMSEIKNTLHADYVRTGFIPDWVHRERPAWQREDRVMDDACHAGLGVMVIVPTGNDKLGTDDLAVTAGAFFTRYTVREKNCKLVAEIGNEDNLTKSPQAYAAIFESEAPEIRKLGVPVIASGTSELDVRWTRAVSALIAPGLTRRIRVSSVRRAARTDARRYRNHVVGDSRERALADLHNGIWFGRGSHAYECDSNARHPAGRDRLRVPLSTE